MSKVQASPVSSSPWRSPGIWMAAFVAAYILFLSIRALVNPAGFAAYYGAPLVNPDDYPFVFVYAIRSIFIGLFAISLLVRRDYRALYVYAFIASIMPVGDAILVASQGASTGTVIRHSLIFVFLLLTGYLIRRWVASQPN